jgi:hypothetical protein
MMKIYLLVTTFLLATSAQALSINGSIVVKGDQRLLIDHDSSRTYILEPSNPDVKKSLNQLSTFDGLRGQVSNKTPDTLILESIDFVSLRRLLGEWHGDSTKVRFADYSRVKFNMGGNSREFLYALSPGMENDWRIYLTDQSSVVLGTLNLDDSHALLEFYDPQTGMTAQQLQLS